MSFYWMALALTVVANIGFHLCQKAIVPNVNPMASVIVTYSMALMSSILMFPVFAKGANFFVEFKKLNWASFTLGFVLLGLEIGYLLAYRLGWDLAKAGLYSNTWVGILLLPIGIFFFKEHLSTINIVGVVLAIVALFLMNYESAVS